jgi:hypothetical protein
MLAVLPFENFSGDPGQEFFSDGMTDEMINWLGRLDAHRLGVIAATSAMKYKNSPKKVSEIGRELGVQIGGRHLGLFRASVAFLRGQECPRHTASLVTVVTCTCDTARFPAPRPPGKL